MLPEFISLRNHEGNKILKSTAGFVIRHHPYADEWDVPLRSMDHKPGGGQYLRYGPVAALHEDLIEARPTCLDSFVGIDHHPETLDAGP
jgi:hypothetical protein